MNKISFKEQLRWTLFSLIGVLAPALVIAHYAGTYTNEVALLLVLFSNIIGFFEGYFIGRDTNKEIIDSQNDLINNSQDLIHEQRKRIAYDGTFWVAQWDHNGTPAYYIGRSPVGSINLNTDIGKAVKFATEGDADQFINDTVMMPEVTKDKLIAVRHQYIELIPDTPKEVEEVK